MADSKLSALAALPGLGLALGDKFYVDDVSAGTSGSKSIRKDELSWALGGTALNIRVFGAQGWTESGNTVDSTTAIQTALDVGGNVYIPPLPAGDYYRITAPLNVTKPTRLFGSGIHSQISAAANFGATNDIVRLLPADASLKTLYSLSDFLLGTEDGNVRHGVHVDMTNANSGLVQFEMRGVGINVNNGVVPLGRSFQLTNPTLQDGFSSCVIRNCLLLGGIEMTRCGDSVVISENTIFNINCGIELSFVSGAAQCVIKNNNITSAGGAVVLHNGLQTKILHNQIEQLATYTGSEAACITLKGDTAQLYDCDITGNNINTLGNVTYCIDVQGATDTRIENNSFNTTTTHVRTGASAVRTVIATSNRFSVGGVRAPMAVTNAGAETAGPWFAVTSFNNSWAAWDAVNYPVKYSKNEAGIVTLEGLLSGGTATTGTVMFTLPVGFWPDHTNLNFAVIAYNAGWNNGNIQINEVGQVLYYSGTNVALGVFCSFRAAP